MDGSIDQNQSQSRGRGFVVIVLSLLLSAIETRVERISVMSQTHPTPKPLLYPSTPSSSSSLLDPPTNASTSIGPSASISALTASSSPCIHSVHMRTTIQFVDTGMYTYKTTHVTHTHLQPIRRVIVLLLHRRRQLLLQRQRRHMQLPRPRQDGRFLLLLLLLPL